MARFRKIDVRIWNDRKFRELDDQAKLAFLLLLTHPDTNQLGLIRTRSVALAFDLGWQPDVMANAIQTLCKTGMLMADEKAGLMFIPNFLKYNPPNGINSAKSWSGILDLLPECDLLDQALVRLKTFIDRLSEGVREGVPEDLKNAIQHVIDKTNLQPCRIQEQEQEQEQEQDLYEQPDGCSWSTPAAPTPELALNEEEKIRPVTKAPIPYQRIVDLYNTKLGPYLRVCKVLNPTRRSNIRARWTDVAKAVKSADPEDVINGFSAYFDKVARSDFLMGKCPASPGHSRPFSADFDWIMNSTNFTCIYEGKYENGRKPR